MPTLTRPNDDLDLSDEPQAILDRLAILYAAKVDAAAHLQTAKEEVKLWREAHDDATRDLNRYHAGLRKPLPLLDGISDR